MLKQCVILLEHCFLSSWSSQVLSGSSYFRVGKSCLQHQVRSSHFRQSKMVVCLLLSLI